MSLSALSTDSIGYCCSAVQPRVAVRTLGSPRAASWRRPTAVATISAVKKNAVRDVAASGPTPQYPIVSVDNALKVLLLLAERTELRLTDVSDYLGVASSSAHRMLAMLLYPGFVRQDPKTKAY